MTNEKTNACIGEGEYDSTPSTACIRESEYNPTPSTACIADGEYDPTPTTACTGEGGYEYYINDSTSSTDFINSINNNTRKWNNLIHVRYFRVFCFF
jgi:hypothetical protein